MTAVDRESALCECGHMRGIHKTRDGWPCATTGCGCKAFRERGSTQAAPPDPPRIIPGHVERELPPGDAGQRAQAAERAAQTVSGIVSDLTAMAGPPPEPQGPVKNFAVHLAARMRALGWDQAALREKSGLSLHVLGRALNGNGVELGIADQLAGIVGGYLATMIGPYQCSTCHGEPPKGFGCLECGTETRAS